MDRHNIHVSFLDLSFEEARAIEEEVLKKFDKDRCPNVFSVITDSSIYCNYQPEIKEPKNGSE